MARPAAREPARPLRRARHAAVPGCGREGPGQWRAQPRSAGSATASPSSRASAGTGRSTAPLKAGEAPPDEREVPSTQMLRYLSRADTLSDRKIQFGILTNGRLWRLYYQGAKSRSEEYLETRPAEPPATGHADTRPAGPAGGRARPLAARLPAPVLRPAPRSWRPTLPGAPSICSRSTRDASGRSRSPAVSRSSSSARSSRRIVQALDAGDPQRPAPRPAAYLAELKESALTLLYRLALRALCRGSRAPAGPRSALRRLRPSRDARRDRAPHRARRHLLDRHRRPTRPACAASSAPSPRGEPALGLPPYNGGLFDPARSPLLERAELPDAALGPGHRPLSRLGPAGAPALDQLPRPQRPAARLDLRGAARVRGRGRTAPTSRVAGRQFRPACQRLVLHARSHWSS